jgi:hypothetical protein
MPVLVRIRRTVYSPRFKNTEMDIVEACRATTFSYTVVTPDDAETSPESIAETQRKDVLRVWKRGERDLQTISRLTVLPVFSVRLRLWELGLAENPWPHGAGQSPISHKPRARLCRPKW